MDTGVRGADGRKISSNPTIEELKCKLKFCTRVTRVCDTTQKVTSATAAEFKRKLERYMDSENDASQGQFWPLVKRVRMTSRNWQLLKTGGKLVDAPGVRDDNNARDKIVKEYLREADGIWIVASINRYIPISLTLPSTLQVHKELPSPYISLCFSVYVSVFIKYTYTYKYKLYLQGGK